MRLAPSFKAYSIIAFLKEAHFLNIISIEKVKEPPLEVQCIIT